MEDVRLLESTGMNLSLLLTGAGCRVGSEAACHSAVSVTGQRNHQEQGKWLFPLPPSINSTVPPEPQEAS